MHVVVFGLCMSSSWGNGHATLWRGLVKALAARGHTVSFYEKDVPYYACARDGWEPPNGVRLHIYTELEEISAQARKELMHADLALTTSYCPDGIAAAKMLLASDAKVKAFYDLDTPVTLSALHSGTPIPYLPPEGLRDFDLVLSYTGGRAIDELTTQLGARVVVPLYGWVDAEVHFPVKPIAEFRSELCYLGTYAADRQAAVEEFFLNPARAQPTSRFTLAGAQYPEDFAWPENVTFLHHLPPSLHPAFFCSARATLNVTRGVMAQYGFCPSGRLFEAAACGVPILTDEWDGLGTFFRLGEEVVPVRRSRDVLDALQMTDRELATIGLAGRERALACHTAMQRVQELEQVCEGLSERVAQPELMH